MVHLYYRIARASDVTRQVGDVKTPQVTLERMMTNAALLLIVQRRDDVTRHAGDVKTPHVTSRER